MLGLSVGLLVSSFTAGVSPGAATPPDDERLFVQLINDLRSRNGLTPLRVDQELTSEARSWTSTMAASQQLAHSADISEGVTSPWTVLGENVGRHRVHDIEGLFDAFVASPAHYDNLVDPRFQYVGVGVIHGEGDEIWTTHRFMAVEAVDTPPPEATELAAAAPDAPSESSPSPPPAGPVGERRPVVRWPAVFYEVGMASDFAPPPGGEARAPAGAGRCEQARSFWAMFIRLASPLDGLCSRS